MTSPVVSVVVATHQRADRLPGLLAALAKQDLPSDLWELVIVDDGSTDATAAVLDDLARTFPGRLEVVHAPVNEGVARARNRGLSRARGAVVALTDDDCRPRPDWLRRGLEALHDGVGVVQGRTVPAAVTGPRAVTQSIDGFSGLYEMCNLFARAEALHEVGGVDESYGFFGEDTATGLAIRARGWEAVFAADAVVEHEVTYPPFRWHLRRAGMYAAFPRLAAAHPEIRDLFWRRWFLNRRTAACLVGTLGFASVPVSPWGALAAVPWVWHHRPRRVRPVELLLLARRLAFDVAVELALVRGSVRHRTIVL